jgi:hypothetical protein
MIVVVMEVEVGSSGRGIMTCVFLQAGAIGCLGSFWGEAVSPDFEL